MLFEHKEIQDKLTDFADRLEECGVIFGNRAETARN